MKNIIQESLEFSCAAWAATTLFNKDNPKKPGIYFDLSRASGKRIKIWYDYTEDGIKKSASQRIVIPEGLDEQGVKAYILSQISS